MAEPRIIVVDHEPVYLRLMEAILKNEGYDVLAVSDGGAAFELIKVEQPAGIILDTWLAGNQQGWGLIQLLRMDPETTTIPLIVVSSDDPKATRERFQEHPSESTTLLFKPFDPEHLVDALREALEFAHG